MKKRPSRLVTTDFTYLQRAPDGKLYPFGFGTYTPDELASIIASRRPFATRLHAAVYLGFIALKTRTATIDEVLGDYGLVHDMVHRELDYTMESPASRTGKLARDLATRIQKLSPLRVKESFRSIEEDEVADYIEGNEENKT